VPKLETTIKTEMDIALEALDRIAEHEKECGERWAECTVELRELRRATDSHAQRWEKLAWLVITIVTTTAATVLLSHLL
jgi:hypothetical protein|tara:strand:+ start:232 stop:468 length:237 start_codon:yes stop_codon:yes gene_type:complete